MHNSIYLATFQSPICGYLDTFLELFGQYGNADFAIYIHDQISDVTV